MFEQLINRDICSLKIKVSLGDLKACSCFDVKKKGQNLSYIRNTAKYFKMVQLSF